MKVSIRTNRLVHQMLTVPVHWAIWSLSILLSNIGFWPSPVIALPLIYHLSLHPFVQFVKIECLWKWFIGRTFLYCTDADVRSGPSFQLPELQIFKAFQQMTLGKNNFSMLVYYAHNNFLYIYKGGQPVAIGQGDTAQGPECSNPACSRACCRKEDGAYHDFCGITCRNKYLSGATGEC